MGIYARQTSGTTTTGPATSPGQTSQPGQTTTNPGQTTRGPTTGPSQPTQNPGPPPTQPAPPNETTDTPSTSTSTTESTSSTPSTTTSLSRPTVLPTNTITSTAIVTAPPTIVPSVVPRPQSKGFFDNKGAVIATFTVVGVAVVIFAFFLTSNYFRRRKARRFDQEVAHAAAEAYADADRAHSWADEDDHWNEGNSRAFSGSTTTGQTQGSYGAYNDPPMSQAPAATGAYYPNYGGNNTEEFPGRGGPQYPYNTSDPFKDPRGFAPGTIVPTGFSGVAGVGAGGLNRSNSSAADSLTNPVTIKHPFANIGAVENGISYDSGPYPVLSGRTRSLRQGSVPTPGRSPSLSSGGHTQSSNGGSQSPPGPQPPVPLLHRLPRTQEDRDENPYDGVAPSESELPNPHPNEKGNIPRVLRIANA